MTNLTQNQSLGLLLAASAFLMLMASGFVFWDAGSLHQLSHEAFRKLCHQQSGRSFSVDGNNMAVCTRCFGIYAGLCCTALVGMLYPRGIRVSLKSALWVAGLVFLLNTADVAGNFIGWWTNTGPSRFAAGLLAGGSLILIIFTAVKPQP